jgi:hypothetical protein
MQRAHYDLPGREGRLESVPDAHKAERTKARQYINKKAQQILYRQDVDIQKI